MSAHPRIIRKNVKHRCFFMGFVTSTSKKYLELSHVSFAFIPLKLLAIVVKVFAVFSAN
jgi:hypothetical protein